MRPGIFSPLTYGEQMSRREPMLAKHDKMTKPTGILQVMPGGRIRIDPSVIPDIAAWIVAQAMPWERESTRTVSGLIGVERVTAERRRQHYIRATNIAQDLVDALCNTLPVESIERARQMWQQGLQPLPVQAMPADGIQDGYLESMGGA